MAHLKYSTTVNDFSGTASSDWSVIGEQPRLEGGQSQEDTLVLEPRTKTKRPPFFKVVMLNDDYTPMDFVVEMLTGIFRHTQEDAVGIMMQIHQKGAGTCGVFTRDVAETKADMVMAAARKGEYPLQCVVEKE